MCLVMLLAGHVLPQPQAFLTIFDVFLCGNYGYQLEDFYDVTSSLRIPPLNTDKNNPFSPLKLIKNTPPIGFILYQCFMM